MQRTRRRSKRQTIAKTSIISFNSSTKSTTIQPHGGRGRGLKTKEISCRSSRGASTATTAALKTTQWFATGTLFHPSRKRRPDANGPWCRFIINLIGWFCEAGSWILLVVIVLALLEFFLGHIWNKTNYKQEYISGTPNFFSLKRTVILIPYRDDCCVILEHTSSFIRRDFFHQHWFQECLMV